MKCHTKSCRRTGNLKTTINGIKYCSERCAQKDLRHLSQKLKSEEQIDSSITPERGGQSSQSSKGEKETQNERESREKTRKGSEKNMNQIETIETRDVQKLQKTADFDDNFLEIEKDKSITAPRTIETQLVSSTDRLTNLQGEQLDTMSLIDDSVMQLHGLAKSITKRIRQRAEQEDKHTYIEPQLVNSACNTAKQIASMLNLKLKFHQEIKKERKG